MTIFQTLPSFRFQSFPYIRLGVCGIGPREGRIVEFAIGQGGAIEARLQQLYLVTSARNAAVDAFLLATGAGEENSDRQHCVGVFAKPKAFEMEDGHRALS